MNRYMKQAKENADKGIAKTMQQYEKDNGVIY